MHVLDMFKLDGKVALVTGCGRGIGQAMCLALAEAGADIAGVYNTRFEATRDKVEAQGKRFLPVQCDLSQASVETLSGTVDQVVAELGQIDVLVNNAGIILRSPALDYSEADWDNVFQVNLKSVYFLSQAAARKMAQQGNGKIIHVASILAFQGGILVPSYAAAKHGLAGLTKAQANEWAAKNINVNAIAPGYIRTDNTTALQEDEERSAALMARVPAGRWGDPEDLKGTTVFLASAASNFMHGEIVTVDGGWMGR